MSSENQTKFNTNSINVTMTKKPGCKVHLDVTVSPEATQACRKKGVSAIRKEVSIPGFRKGKAPEEMISENYSKQIDREWKDLLLQTSFDEALKLVKIYPFNKSSVTSANLKSVSLTDGATLVYEYEAAPEIPTVDAKELSIPKVALKTVTDKDVQHAIEELCLQSAEWSDITDRPVQEGDYVVIDIDDVSGPVRSICKATLFPVDKQMGTWMRKLLIGMTPEQTAEGMSEQETHDENCHECAEGTHKHPEFIPTLCRITLHNIRHAIPHPLDEALAKKYGAGSVEQLTERVKASLENRAVAERNDAQRLLMEKAIFEKYSFDMPASLVQSELKAAKQPILDKLKAEGVPDSAIHAEARKVEEQVARKYDRDFRLYFLTQKAAHENKIEVTKDEIVTEMMRQMWLQQSGQSTLNFSGDPKTMELQVQMQLLASKVLDFFIEKATSH